MVLKGSADRYGTLAAGLHWLSALAVMALLVLGFAAAWSSAPGWTVLLLRVHVPLGLLILGLTVARLLWRFADRRPDAPAGQPRWQALAAGANHAALYVALLVMGTSGTALLIQSGLGAALRSDASGPLPQFRDFAPMTVHATVALAILALLALHLGAVAFHHLRRRDRLLARMGVGALAERPR